MAGRTPHEAYSNFVQPLQQAVSCVTDAVLIVRGGGYSPRDEPYVLSIGGTTAVSVVGPHGARFGISIAQQYRLVEDASTLGPWRVTTAAYAYALLTSADGDEIFGYHWHPRGHSPITTPHFHFGSGARVERPDVADAHFPSGRVALEEFLRCIIRDFRVTPQRDDWQSVLDATQQAFETYRTWPWWGSMSESTPLRVNYDEQFDVLEIFFQTEPALTIELEEDIYAHVVPATRKVIGFTVHHFRRSHAQFVVPFHCTLVPASPLVRKVIEEALRPD